MEVPIAVLIGVLFAAGTYSLMRRSAFKIVVGIMLISQGVNLLVFTSGGLMAGRSPLIAPDQDELPPPFSDPLPQAMVLTAIVISFGLTAFLLCLAWRAHVAVGSDDINAFNQTDT